MGLYKVAYFTLCDCSGQDIAGPVWLAHTSLLFVHILNLIDW